ISYDYDDDFNKIEIKKIIKDKIWDIQAVLGTDKATLDSVFRQTKIYKSKKDTLLFKGSNFVLKKIGKEHLCYNKHVDQPNLHKKIKTENFSTELNYKYFIPLLQEIGIDKDSLQLNKFEFEKLKLSISKKEHINLSCSFHFADKEKNSFFSIVENWE
ncbi:MAG: hypothetical protein DRJ10_10465, partial [Bacteroidetes bacterium]